MFAALIWSSDEYFLPPGSPPYSRHSPSRATYGAEESEATRQTAAVTVDATAAAAWGRERLNTSEIELSTEFEQPCAEHRQWPLPLRAIHIVHSQNGIRVENVEEVDGPLDVHSSEP